MITHDLPSLNKLNKRMPEGVGPLGEMFERFARTQSVKSSPNTTFKLQNKAFGRMPFVSL